MDNLKSADFDFHEFKPQDPNTYVYVRVSTDKQDTSSQLKSVYDYCKRKLIYPLCKNIYIDDGISGTKDWRGRKLGIILETCNKNSILIIPEISRLSRNNNSTHAFFDECDKKKIIIHDIKNNLIIDKKDESSQMMATLFSIGAQMERKLISQRTKDAMAKTEVREKMRVKRQERIYNNKLAGKEDLIKSLLSSGTSYNKIARDLNVNPGQLYVFVKKYNLN